MHYKNPILSGFYPDPSVCRVGEDYYLVTSSFEYFPGVPIFHSKDLIHWQQIGHCLTRASQVPLNEVSPSGGVWAPTIRYHDGVFYMTTTNVNGHGNFYVTTTNPAGEWSEPIWLSIGGIDPSFTFEDDTVYYTVSHPFPDGLWGVAQAELDIKTGKIIGELHYIWKGSGGKSPEAPHLYKIGQTYYLMIAEGGTYFTHMETIARSDSPWGPFESCPRNPILTNMQALVPDVQCTGHCDLVQDHHGNWWMVLLGIRIAQKYMGHMGRETFLVPVAWDKDGWPIVNGGNPVAIDSEGPCLPEVKLNSEAALDHFNEETLAFYWNHLRNPYPEDYSLTYKKGFMTLWGNAYEISDLDSPALLCRRQKYYECDITTALDFKPETEHEEAGLVIFITNEFYFKLIKKRINGKNYLTLEKRADDFFQRAACVEISDATIHLKVIADRLHYHFYYGYSEDEMVLLGSASARFLSCELVGRCFTGTMIGIYATGKGSRSTAPASFDYFGLI